SRMMVSRGFGLSSVLDTGGMYAPVNDAWDATATLNAPLPRQIHTAVWTGSEMIVWGGTDSGNTAAIGTGGRYDPIGNSWQSTSDVGAPAGRRNHTAVWTGGRMIV